MSGRQDDRRHAVRHAASDRGIAGARVRPGNDVDIVDVSAGGMLVESDRRLLPGACVDVQLDTPGRTVVVRGRVVRCAVARLRSSSVCYRGAICFDQHLPWFVEAEGAGYGVPAAEMALRAERRVDATRHRR